MACCLSVISIFIVAVQFIFKVLPWLYETFGPMILGSKIRFTKFGDWACKFNVFYPHLGNNFEFYAFFPSESENNPRQFGRVRGRERRKGSLNSVHYGHNARLINRIKFRLISAYIALIDYNTCTLLSSLNSNRVIFLVRSERKK